MRDTSLLSTSLEILASLRVLPVAGETWDLSGVTVLQVLCSLRAATLNCRAPAEITAQKACKHLITDAVLLLDGCFSCARPALPSRK